MVKTKIISRLRLFHTDGAATNDYFLLSDNHCCYKTVENTNNSLKMSSDLFALGPKI